MAVTRSHTRMKLVVVGDLLITVSVAGSVDGGVLNERDMKQLIGALKSGPVTKYLAGFIGSASSTATQRKEGAELIRSRNIPVAVVTDDRLVRGFVTAVSWIGANVSAFSWANTAGALKYLAIAADRADEVLATFSKLRAAASVD
jgi:hypothetical protein